MSDCQKRAVYDAEVNVRKANISLTLEKQMDLGLGLKA